MCCLESWEPQPPGNLRACPGLSWYCFAFYLLDDALTALLVMLGLVSPQILEFSLHIHGSFGADSTSTLSFGHRMN